MDTQTMVSIYEVDDAGATGRWLGSASLVQPELVLVHPPLSDRLAGSDRAPASLRVGIVAQPDAEGIEIVETRGTHVGAADAGGSATPIVVLELARPSSFPPEPLPPYTDGEGLAEVLRAHLDGLPEQPRRRPGAAMRSSPWCLLFSDWC
jgi:hypothetical protein